ncbi:MAG: hypothetical protein MMC23_002350 [Stictis urceolatum]|nr:hypothetical protein [Stictis urceolata]
MSPPNRNVLSPWARSEPGRESYGSLRCALFDFLMDPVETSSPSYGRGSIEFAAPASIDGRQELYASTASAAFMPPQPPYPNSSQSSYGSHSYDPRDSRSSSRMSSTFPAPGRSSGPWPEMSRPLHHHGSSDVSRSQFPIAITPSDRALMDYENRKRTSPDNFSLEGDESPTWSHVDPNQDGQGGWPRAASKTQPQRRPANRDEFDGPHQFLDKPSLDTIESQEGELPHLSTNLFVSEQDEILSKVNDCLSKCAFDFVAKYQFPIPLEADKRPVRIPADREWTEWVYLLKRLATKRRIPARVLYNGQIKQLVTVLENSLEMRHAAKHQSRPLKDDRNVLQLISAGLQVAKILKDASAMGFLDHIYAQTEQLIQKRRSTPGYM